MKLITWFAGLALVFAAHAAHAADPQSGRLDWPGRSVSDTIWTIDGSTVHLRYVLPLSEAGELALPGGARPDAGAVGQAVGAAVSVGSEGGDCPEIDQGEGVGQVYTLAMTPGFDRYEIIFACPSAARIRLHDGVLFDRAPGHVDYARVQVDGGPPALQVFTRGHETLALPPGRLPPGASLVRFAVEGALRFVEGAGLAIAAALLLLQRRWRDIGATAVALVGGYAASLAATLLGLAAPDEALAAALAATMVVFTAAGALAGFAAGAGGSRSFAVWSAALVALLIAAVAALAAVRSVPAGIATAGVLAFGAVALWLGSAGRAWRWLLFAPAAVFAFLDGLGAAGGLSPLRPPLASVAIMLTGYGLGAAGAGILLVGGAAAISRLFRRRFERAGSVLAELGGAILIGLGLFWFASWLQA